MTRAEAFEIAQRQRDALLAPFMDKIKALRAERDRYREALEEIERRTGLLIHQNTGRWDMSVEHDRRSYHVSEGNLEIASQALKGEA